MAHYHADAEHLRICHPEAGHAVTAVALGGTVSSAHASATSGVVWFDTRSPDLRNALAVVTAGCVAEDLFCMSVDPRWTARRVSSRLLRGGLPDPNDGRDDDVYQASMDACRLARWHNLGADVGDALQLVLEAELEAERILLARWADVRLLAGRLAEAPGGRMDGAEVHRLLRG